MPIIPVLDLKQGLVVRGIGGRRDEYKPIVSKFTSSADPTIVARALREHFGFGTFYLADLDAIGGEPAARAIYAALQDAGLRLWVDAGVRGVSDALALRALNVNGIVVGLETLRGPEALGEIRRALHPDALLFSLDLKGGHPLGDLGPWGTSDSWAIAERAVAVGVGRLIVLDLARVGTGGGVGTEDLCCRLRRSFPHLEITAGGGVRGPDDVRALYDAGVDNVLVASALHDGRILPHHRQ